MSSSKERFLERVVIVYESEAAARERLAKFGYAADIAAEIAVYLAQATDLVGLMAELRAGLAAEGLAVTFVELDDLLAAIGEFEDREGTLLWCQTDGLRYYRGSAVASLSRLAGIARYGSPPLPQHLCQDKFGSACLAQAAGLPTVPTLLLEGAQTIATLGTADWDGELFVKPATLGAKIGIFADSRCRGLDEARSRTLRLWERYGDRALVQPFIAGSDVRVSFMNTGRAFAAQLGLFRLAKDERSETGGDFMTMRDNETLSGAKDTAGARGAFGEERAAAFVPRMIDLRAEDHPAVGAITQSATAFARLLRLDDYFSMDFRLDGAGAPHFLEFEVCPAVTIYDFAEYLRGVHGLGLGAALARSFRLAHARRFDRSEA
jgi:D-alanine-D-alanine ligase